MIDTTPDSPSPDNLVERIRSVANQENFHVHDITVIDVKGQTLVNLDLEVDPTLPLTTAHERATTLETLVRRSVPGVHDINVHIEPRRESVATAEDAPGMQAHMEGTLREVVRSVPEVIDCHSIEVHQANDEMVVTVHCTLRPGLSVERAHDITEQLELEIRERFHQNMTVNIHAEPATGDVRPPSGS